MLGLKRTFIYRGTGLLHYAWLFILFLIKFDTDNILNTVISSAPHYHINLESHCMVVDGCKCQCLHVVKFHNAL